MEALKNKWRNLPLRRFLMLTVCGSVAAVTIVSALIISGCAAFRHWLLPYPDAVYLTVEETLSDGSVTESVYLLGLGEEASALPFLEIGDGEREKVKESRYAIEKVETGADSLTPKRKLAYQACGIAMYAAPTVLALAAIFWCSLYFYRRRLKTPLELLSGAAEKIAAQDLDFEIVYSCGDEMGALCRSFEEMRAALLENKKELWKMLEERRLLQASVAHDLRNPIAVIEGYAEYLETALMSGRADRENTARIVRNLGAAAKRLEQYTESVRLVNQSEEEQISREPVAAPLLADAVSSDLSVLAEQNGILLLVEDSLPDKEIQVDPALLCRVLENVMSNALRCAKREIRLDFSLQGSMLAVTVTDDGKGFPEEVLHGRENRLFTPGPDGHMGIGLSISRLLCRKHGGRLELSNLPCGACVKILLSV